MHFQIKRDTLLKSLNIAHNIIERKNTLPILSNVLLEAKNNRLTIVATDLDLVFHDEIQELKIIQDGSTTTSATVLHDLLRKLTSNLDVTFNLKDENKLNISAENSKFNLLCLPVNNFPNFSDNFNGEGINLNKKTFLSLLNKTKISMSNDETRHYLNGIFVHTAESNGKLYLTAVATDSHRLSSSSLEIEKNIVFEPIILPKKTIFQLISLMEQSSAKIKISNNKSKVKFVMDSGILISKVIDGRFPDYSKVVPKDNNKILQIKLNEFKTSIERVTTVSADKKEGLKMGIKKDSLQLSVNSPNSGEGVENISANFNSEDMSISFNSRYLIDITSQIENEKIIMNLKEPGSPVLIKDLSDKLSFHVVMPMKI